MTGIEDLNYPEFKSVEQQLLYFGYEVSNPAQYDIVEGMSWSDCMRRDIKDLVQCNGVCLLDGWLDSKGAKLEEHIATALGIKTGTIWYWIQRATVGLR